MTSPRQQTEPLRDALARQQRQREVMQQTARDIAREREQGQPSTEEGTEES